jgi:diadenosine tetraphosphate (Ap4A) HIT family hydrolase
LLAESGELALFADRSPQSSLHFLVVTKYHIASVRTLTSADLPLLEQMRDFALSFVRSLPESSGRDVRLGFHVPPFISVAHLHLHVFVMPWTACTAPCVYSPGTPWFRTLETVLDDLRAEAARQKAAGGPLITAHDTAHTASA